MKKFISQTAVTNNKTKIMKKYTVISVNPEDTYQNGIFLTRSLASVMKRGLEREYNEQFKVVEIN